MHSIQDIKKVPITQVAELAGYRVFKGQLYTGEESHSCFVDEERNIFKWFAREKGGSVIDFVMTVEDCTFDEACGLLDKLLNNKSVSMQTVVKVNKPKKAPVRIDRAVVQKAALELSERGRDYWVRRGVSTDTLLEHQIGEVKLYGKDWFTFPVVDNALLPVYLKLRICPWSEAEGKGMTFPTGHSAFLFPYKSLKKRPEVLVLCEGESDTLVALSRGLQAICGTHGATTFTDSMMDHVANSYPKHVLIAYDNDEAGQRGAEKVARKLEKRNIEHSIFTIPKPHTDLAEYLLAEPEGHITLLNSLHTHV